MYSIDVKNLTKRFGSFTSVNNISFSVKKGEIFGFLGANGAGKSTTIKMLCGIIAPTYGDATVGGFSIMNEPGKVKTKIGYMSQHFSLYNDLTVEENINFFAGIYGLEGKFLSEKKKWILDIANLNGKEKKLTASLPGGIKQRLALGTAVIHEPEIVFLDEPTSGVDPLSRRSFWELINNLSGNGTTVFVTTHYIEEAEYCNTIMFIDSGKIIAGGSSKELKTKYLTNIVFEIECSNPAEAFNNLEKEEWIEEISLFGNNIHLFVKSSEGKEVLIRNVVERNKDNIIYRVDEIVPALEDVFIHLLEKRQSHA